MAPRAKWTSRPQSDLDLVVFATPEQNGQVGELREAFEESNLPFRVDLFVWAAVPEQFRKHIKRDHVVVCSGGKHGTEDKWEKLTPLRDLCKSVVDCHHSTPVWTDTGVIVLRNQNIRNGRLDLSEPSYTDERHYAERTRRAAPRSGDLVITREAPMGEVCMVPAGLRFCLGQRMVLLRPDPAKTVPRYLLYALQSKTVRHEIGVSEGTGSTVSNLRIPLLEALPIPSRPLPEQRAIAHILGTLDDKIELNRRMNATLEAMARALFKSWFVDFDPVRAKMEGRDPGLPKHLADLFPDRLVDSELGEIPEGWKVKRIEDMAERVSMGPFGSSIKVATFLEAGIPVISGQHLRGTLLDDNEYRFITKEHAERLAKANVRRGDVVFTHAGSIGQVAYIPKMSQFKRYVISQRQFYMRCDVSQISPLFVVHFFKTIEGQHQLLANTSSTGVPSISRPVTYLRSIRLCIPPRALWRQFDEFVDVLHLKAARNTAESNILDAQRDTLLPKLISGELRVRHAEIQQLVGRT